MLVANSRSGSGSEPFDLTFGGNRRSEQIDMFSFRWTFVTFWLLERLKVSVGCGMNENRRLANTDSGQVPKRLKEMLVVLES
jgi:hypothetical protein